MLHILLTLLVLLIINIMAMGIMFHRFGRYLFERISQEESDLDKTLRSVIYLGNQAIDRHKEVKALAEKILSETEDIGIAIIPEKARKKAVFEVISDHFDKLYYDGLERKERGTGSPENSDTIHAAALMEKLHKVNQKFQIDEDRNT